MESPGVLSLDLWTDGACSGHPGLGGWAALLVGEGPVLAVYGWEPSTTNNRMELVGVLEGLKAIGEESALVTIHTDSAYVKNAHTQGWLRRWQANGWISSRGDPVANQDLWAQLCEQVAKHQVSWKHIRGHQKTVNENNRYNHQADALAVRAKQQQLAGTELL